MNRLVRKSVIKVLNAIDREYLENLTNPDFDEVTFIKGILESGQIAGMLSAFGFAIAVCKPNQEAK